MSFRLLGFMFEVELTSLFVRMPFVGEIHISPLGVYADPWSRSRHG